MGAFGSTSDVCKIVLALAVLAQAEFIEINSSYPLGGNYSFIELQCVYNSSSIEPGASFQLNGTVFAENIPEREILFTLTPENEGVFTCSLAGLFSTNAIGLAGQE